MLAHQTARGWVADSNHHKTIHAPTIAAAWGFFNGELYCKKELL